MAEAVNKITKGSRVTWKYIHHLNSKSATVRFKNGVYIGNIKHTRKHWEGHNALQMACVQFDGNKNSSIVILGELSEE